MALFLRQTIKPAGNFPVVEAEDVLMHDGSRLSDNASIFLVTVTTENYKVTASHSASEIKAATESGKVVLLKSLLTSEPQKVYAFSHFSNEGYACFCRMEHLDTGAYRLAGFAVHEDKLAQMTGFGDDIYPVPNPSEYWDDEVPKYLSNENGELVWKEVSDSLDIVTYDLASQGVPAIVVNGDGLRLEMDTTELREAMQTSMLKFLINMEYQGLAFSNATFMFLPNSNVSYVNFFGFVLRVVFDVNETGITIRATLGANVPAIGVSGNGKILQVVEGNPTWVSPADAGVVDSNTVVSAFDELYEEKLEQLKKSSVVADRDWQGYDKFSNGFEGILAARVAASYALAVRNGTDNIIHVSSGSLPFMDVNFKEVIAAGGLRVRDENGAGVTDCSNFAGLVLRGIDYDRSFYPKHKAPNETWNPQEELRSMYGSWGLATLDKQAPGKYYDLGFERYSTIRLANDFANYFRDNAYVIYDAETDGEITSDITNSLEPGDVVFQKDAGSADNTIVHMFIVSERKDRIWECSHGFSPQINYGEISARLSNIRLVVRPDYRGDMEKRIQNMMLHSPTYNEVPYGVNLMSYPWRMSGAAGSYTEKGITMNFKSMNTINLSGTSTGSIELSLSGLQNVDGLKLPAGKYKISGMTGTGVTNAYVALQVRKLNNSDFSEKIRCYDGNDVEFELKEPEEVFVRLYIGSGYTLNCDITPRLERLS